MAQAGPKDNERISMYYRLVIPEGDETESIVEEFRRAFVSHIKDVDGLPDNEILFEKNRYTEGRSIKFAKNHDCLIDEVNVDKQTGTPTTVSLVYSPNPQEEYVDQPVDDVVDSLSSGLDDDTDSTDDVAGSNDATDIFLAIADDDSVEDEPNAVVDEDNDAAQVAEDDGSKDLVSEDDASLDNEVVTEDFSNTFVKTDDNSTDNVGSFTYIDSPVDSENSVSEDDPLSDILPSVEDLREEVSTPLNLGDTLNDPYLKMSKDMLDAQLSMERAQVRFAVNSLTKSDVNRLMEEIRERASHDEVLSKYVQAALDKAQSDRNYEQRRNAVANAYSIALEHYVASKIEEIKATYRAEHPDDTDERIAQFESENHEQRNKEEKSFFDARLDAQNRVVEITSEGENNSVISKVLSFVLLKRSFKSLFNNAREEVRVAQNAKNKANEVEYEPAHYAQQPEDSFEYSDDDTPLDNSDDNVYDNSDVDDEPVSGDSYDDAFNAGYQKALEDILARQEENDSVEDDADDVVDDVVDEPADGDSYELTDDDLFDDDVDDEPADTSNEVVDEGDGNEDFEPKTDVEADEPEDEDSTKDPDSEGEETPEDQTPEVQDGGEPVEESLSETEDNDSEVATNDDDDSDDADDFDFVDEPADDDAESDSSVTTTLDPVPEVQKDEDSEKHDEPVVETPSTPEVVSPVDTATKKPKKNHHKILQRVGIGVAAVALAAGLYIGVGGMVFHLPPFQQTQQEAPVTDNQNIMDQIHEKFKAGQTVTITDNGQQKKATVTDVTTDGVNVKDDAGNQYTLSPQLAQAYVNAHPEQFKTDGGAQNTSDATTQH
jgi:pilus assembly protein FimV